jgi:GntP family gluconate:H+ symporter
VPLLGTLGAATALDKAIIVVAIGAGSAVVSHVNDSFFWVVTQLSGMNVKVGYKVYTLGSGILGFAAMIILTVISLFM